MNLLFLKLEVDIVADRDSKGTKEEVPASSEAGAAGTRMERPDQQTKCEDQTNRELEENVKKRNMGSTLTQDNTETLKKAKRNETDRGVKSK